MRTTHLLTDTCSHGTGAKFCWQGVLNIGTPQWHYITCSLKSNVVCKVQSTGIQEVLSSLNSRKEYSTNFDEPYMLA